MREEQDENGKKNGQKSFFHLQNRFRGNTCPITSLPLQITRLYVKSAQPHNETAAL